MGDNSIPDTNIGGPALGGPAGFTGRSGFGNLRLTPAGKNFIFITFVLISIISLILLIYVNDISVPADYMLTSEEYDDVTSLLEWTFFFIGMTLIVLSWFTFYKFGYNGNILPAGAAFIFGSVLAWISVIQKQYRGYFSGTGMDVGIHIIQFIAIVSGCVCLYYI